MIYKDNLLVLIDLQYRVTLPNSEGSLFCTSIRSKRLCLEIVVNVTANLTHFNVDNHDKEQSQRRHLYLIFTHEVGAG